MTAQSKYPPGRGRYGRTRPRPGLTRDGIVDAARAVIVRDGLDAMTMRSVAAELDTAATSLYRHIRDRDALLLAVLEQVAAGMPVDVPAADLGQRLHLRLVRAHDYLAEHIWVLHVLIRGDLVAENAFAFSDACLRDFRDAGLGVADAFAAFRGCWHLMIGELLDTHPLTPPSRPSQRDRAVAAADPSRYPALAEARDLQAAVSKGENFAMLAKTLLDGLLT